MTTASFVKKNGNYCGFRVCGHSGYAESGSDIVCAAVSAMVQMTVNLITEDFAIEAEIEIDEEKALIGLKLNAVNETANALINGLEREISALSNDYPKYVKVTVKQ